MNKILIVLVCLFFRTALFAQDDYAGLYEGFRDPPASARPLTWWHWTGGNITLDGISKDLQWMKASGIAGFQLADVAFGSGPAVDQPVLFGSPSWQEALRHAAYEAGRLGL